MSTYGPPPPLVVEAERGAYSREAFSRSVRTSRVDRVSGESENSRSAEHSRSPESPRLDANGRRERALDEMRREARRLDSLAQRATARPSCFGGLDTGTVEDGAVRLSQGRYEYSEARSPMQERWRDGGIIRRSLPLSLYSAVIMATMNSNLQGAGKIAKGGHRGSVGERTHVSTGIATGFSGGLSASRTITHHDGWAVILPLVIVLLLSMATQVFPVPYPCLTLGLYLYYYHYRSIPYPTAPHHSVAPCGMGRSSSCTTCAPSSSTHRCV